MAPNIDIQSVKQRFGIIGNSPLLNQALERAIQVAATDINVLITGESGTGKESFSKIIHQLSSRRHAIFTAVNCGAIPEGTIDSELFGHEKGAFTGAIEARKGFFEVCNGGTIFLDEIGEMPLNTQARLLRVLENGEFIKVGSSKVQKTDVRVVAATNVNMEDAISKNKFREDLYYRLSTVKIYVPTLRERGNDMLLLFRKFASDFSDTYHTPAIELDDPAKILLMNYNFPGNIRQLKNLVYDLAITSAQQLISEETLLRYLPKPRGTTLPIPLHEGDSSVSEREILYKVLFDVKKDVTELKKLIFQIIDSGNQIDTNLINQHKELFNEFQGTSNLPMPFQEVKALQNPMLPYVGVEEDTDQIEDIAHETEEESLSLEKKEKEMIIKALKHHGGKRKYAAEDLGISERTLYRKIKKYDLESL